MGLEPTSFRTHATELLPPTATDGEYSRISRFHTGERLRPRCRVSPAPFVVGVEAG
jgi:hypothetical protein